MISYSQLLNVVFPALVISTLIACSSNHPSQASGLEWAACDDTDVIFECTTLAVPMDYSAPTEKQIELSLIRHRSTGTERLGSLFINFGGAAGRGINDVQDIIDDEILPNSILSAYDIVGFNPRGTEGSTPVDCSDVNDTAFNPYPTNADAITQLHNDYVQFSTDCVDKYSEYLQQIGSLNTARDLEQIRIAMADEKVNFLAYSFASRVAALYLQEYPESSGRFILDGSVSPDSSLRIVLSEPLSLMQAKLRSILSECITSDPECNPDELITKLAQRLNFLANENNESAQEEFDLIFLILGVSVEDPEIGRIISSQIVDYINTFDFSILEALVNNDSDQEDELVEGDDGFTVDIATLCADDEFRPVVSELLTALEDFNQLSDVFAEDSLAEYASCAGWPVSLNPLAPITTNSAPISIVIGGANDAIAPIALSEEMAAAIGGMFIRSDHEGHISVFLGKSDCIDDLVEAYLLEATTPAVAQCIR